MNRHVWMMGDADALIYREDDDGNYMDTDPAPPHDPIPVLTYCFLQGVTLSSRNPAIQRRAVTGRGRRKIVPVSKFFDDVNCQIEHMLFQKADEFNTSQIFNPLQQLRVALRFVDITYIDISPFENDSFELSFARATAFSITGKDADNAIATAEFEAEMLL